MLLLRCNLRFLVHLICCDDILVFYLVTLVVYLFLNIVATLVATGFDGAIVMIDTSLAVFLSSISTPISDT